MNERITAESGCPDCAKVPEAAARVERASEAARELAPLIRDLTERTRQVSAEARSLLGLLRHLVRDVTALSDVHPRCGVCGLLAGPGHVVSALQLEPRGRERVCATCYGELRARGTTAAAYVRAQIEAERDELAEDRTV